MSSRRKSAFALFVVLLANPFAAGQKRTKESEQRADHYKKWLDEDVFYIISSQEREVFGKLSTNDEKDHFIEQFWMRRDPDPATSANEFKEEHYRRIQYANERFTSGKPGWRSDRGRFYIKFGPPDQKESYAGGPYARKPYEGGGTTSTYPFEVWWYRNIEGLGSELEVEFIDDSMTGDYRLALHPDEKDALFNLAGAGPTLAEQSGKLSRSDRMHYRYYGNPHNKDFGVEDPWGFRRMQDEPWYKLNQIMQAEKPLPLKNPKFKELVSARVIYSRKLPVQYQCAYYKLNEREYLVPFWLTVKNNDLSYKRSPEGIYSGELSIYVRVTGLNGRNYYEFDDTLSSHYTTEEFPKKSYQSSAYQRLLRLPAGRFKVQLLVSDEDGQGVGSHDFGLTLPDISNRSDQLTLSPVVLSQYLSRLLAVPDKLTTFVIGDVRVIPSFGKTFEPSATLGVYLQAYGFQVDSSTSRPVVTVRFQISDQEGNMVRDYVDDEGRSYSVHSNIRLVVTRKLPLLNLPAGKYRLKVIVEDAVAHTERTDSVDFEVVAPQRAAKIG